MAINLKGFDHLEELDIYFRELAKYKKLTKEEERELGRRIKKGDRRAIDKMIRHNLKFVVLLAKKYRTVPNVTFTDLISEGNIGLMKAAEKYDVDRGMTFASYARWWINSSINDFIEKVNGNTEYTVMEDEEIARVSDKMGDYDDVNKDLEKKMEDYHSRTAAIEDLIQCLEEREKKIILLFFGLGGTKHEMNLDEISQVMNITKERVRQIKDNAIVKLKCEALMSPEYETYKSL
jgi:RNA polymerase primary sigma factor